jgi:hypothetical protein
MWFNFFCFALFVLLSFLFLILAFLFLVSLGTSHPSSVGCRGVDGLRWPFYSISLPSIMTWLCLIDPALAYPVP